MRQACYSGTIEVLLEAWEMYEVRARSEVTALAIQGDIVERCIDVPGEGVSFRVNIVQCVVGCPISYELR